jgi:spore germination protein
MRIASRVFAGFVVLVAGAFMSGCGSGGGGSSSSSPFAAAATIAGATSGSTASASTPATTPATTGATVSTIPTTPTTSTAPTPTTPTTSTPPTRTPAPGQPLYRVSGWQPYWANTAGDQTLTANVGDGLDEVNLFGYRLGADGSITPTTGAESAARHALVRARHGELIPTVLDVDNAANMATVLASTANQRRTIDGIIAVIDRFGYDGIDIDFEHVTATTRQAFNRMMQDLSAAVHGRGKVLSITVPGKRADTPSWPGYDFAALGAAADRIKIMTYGYSGSWSRTPGPIAPTTWIRTCMNYAITTMPARKIQIGIPFYGFDWPNDTTSPIVAVTWSSAQSRLARSTTGLRFDATLGETTFTYTDANGLGHTVWLQDERAVAAKCEVVKQYGAGGLAIWSLGNEPTSFWDAIRRVLKSPTP